MSKELPARPNLEHLKAQAKDLLEAIRRGDEAARSRVHAAIGSQGESIALHDAQLVVAREYGLPSWKALREAVEHAENVAALMRRHVGAPLPEAVQRALAKTMAERADVEVPRELPVIALRNALLTVGIRAPLNIGRPSSLAAIRAGTPLAIFAQTNEATEAPTEDDLHRVGVAVDVTDVIETDDRGTWIVIRTFASIRLEALTQTAPYLRARVTPFVVRGADSPEVKRLEAALREKVRAFAQRLPNPELLLRATESMDARELGDVVLANLGCSVAEKALVAGEEDLAARLQSLLALFERAA